MKKLSHSPFEIVTNAEGLYEGNLVPYYKTLTVDSTGRSNPYHNTSHILDVLQAVYEGGKFHGLTGEDLLSLCIAAIFHDMNHPGESRGKDRFNIEVALVMLRANILPQHRAQIDKISEIIWATEFPYKIPSNELSLSQQIMRDADLCQNFSPAWIQQCWFGLAEELRCDPVGFLGTRPAFLRAVEFQSGWGKTVLEPKRLAAIIEAEDQIRALGENMPSEYRLAV